MAFVDVIDDYSNGATGTLATASGGSVGYTVSGNATTRDWKDLDGGAKVTADGQETFTVTFDEPVVGVVLLLSSGDSDEIYYVVVDGEVVDLNDLIADGSVTFTVEDGGTHTIQSDGAFAGGNYKDASIAQLTFNVEISSIGAYGTNGNSSNWDYFEVGIDDSVFDVVCFTRDTKIETENGIRPIQTLQVGDRVRTLSGALKPIRWIGRKLFNEQHLAQHPKLRPVRICAGALGSGFPKHDLLLSRQHRVMLASKISERMFGEEQTLIAAVLLTEMSGIYVDDDITEVEYFHILFDQHEVIFSEGVPAESLFLGREAISSVPKAALEELQEMFPELSGAGFTRQDLAVFEAERRQQKKLLQRHLKNKKPLITRPL